MQEWFFQSTLPVVAHLCWATQNSHWCLGIWCRISSRVAWPFHTLLDSVPTWGSLGLILQSKLFGSANNLRNLLWFSLKELLMIAVNQWFNPPPLSTWDFRSEPRPRQKKFKPELTTSRRLNNFIRTKSISLNNLNIISVFIVTAFASASHVEFSSATSNT